MNKQFFKDKFLNLEDVEELRNELKKFSKEILLQNDEILDAKDIILVKKKILNQNLLSLLQNNLNEKEFYFLNKIKIKKNKREYGNKWHKDSGKPHQHKLIFKKNNIFIKLGIYLQKNDKKIGGGIDVIKPFKSSFLNHYNIFSNFVRKLYYSFKIRTDKNFLEIDTGEIVGFGGLVFHQTTPTRVEKNINLDDRFTFYLLIINKSLITDTISIYNKLKPDNPIDIDNNLEKTIYNDCEFNVCNTKLSDAIEEILSD